MSSEEGILKMILERVERLEERVESLRRRYRSQKRRNQLALEKLKDAIAEFEADHVEAGLEILYDVERLLEVAEE